MSKVTTAYKVVTKNWCDIAHKYNLKSVTSTNAITYSLDTWIKPNFGRIFCFSDLEQAIVFRQANAPASGVIFLAQTLNPVPSQLRGSVTSSYDQKRFWDIYFEHGGLASRILATGYAAGAPDHTIFAEEIKLLAEIPYHKVKL